jgi:histone deacetylase 11
MMRFFRKAKCKIVYRSEYLSTIHAQNAHRSFDVMRFKKVRDQLIKEKLTKPKEILKAPRISDEDLLLVHTKDYLDSLKNPITVGEILNLDYVNPWDEYIMEYFRYVSGGTLLATEYTLENETIVFNLGGGYHHAHPDRGEGFCLINDVAIAIRKMQAQQKAKRFLIIDLDYHQGNGNLLYFQSDEDIFTFSMHADKWDEISGKKNNIDIELPAHSKDQMYLDILRKELPGVYTIFSPDLVFYIAGSDPYILDTLGDFDISEEGMLERDKIVYQESKNYDLPLVVLGAGGYGPESWKIYYNFIKWVTREG